MNAKPGTTFDMEFIVLEQNVQYPRQVSVKRTIIIAEPCPTGQNLYRQWRAAVQRVGMRRASHVVRNGCSRRRERHP